MYKDNTNIDGIKLNIREISPNRSQKTRKNIVGRNLIQVDILGMGEQQWNLEIEGVLVGDNFEDLAEKRQEIQDLDDCELHEYEDGIHDGYYYIIPGSIVFDDSGDKANMYYTYTIRLVEN